MNEFIGGMLTSSPIFFMLGFIYCLCLFSKGKIKRVKLKRDILKKIFLKGDAMNRKGMTLIQVVMFVLIVGILVILVLMVTQPKVHAGDFSADLAGFQKERGETIERINQYQQVIDNNKFRLAQLDALILYAQHQIVEQEKPKNQSKVKRYKVEMGRGQTDKITVPLEELEEMPTEDVIKELTTLSGTANEKKK
jgi:hypothetical protein